MLWSAVRTAFSGGSVECTEMQACHGVVNANHCCFAGVTLNHLSWARLLGAPTGLLAAQGEDDNGRMIRSKLEQLDVSTSAIVVSAESTTSVSHVLLDAQGERAILMAKASTGTLDAETMARYFSDAVASASMLTTEVSQLPLSGALWLLQQAAARGIPGCIDVDVPVSVALGDAALGSAEELLAAMEVATVVKLTGATSESLLLLYSEQRGVDVRSVMQGGSLGDRASLIRDLTGAAVVAITDGSSGAVLSARGVPGAVRAAAVGGVRQADATGAGDAFMGGMVAWMHAEGIPGDGESLTAMGAVAGAAGAACCEVVGALPVLGVSDARLVELEPRAAALLQRRPVLVQTALGHAAGDGNGEAAGEEKEDAPVDEVAEGVSRAALISIMLDCETAFAVGSAYREMAQSSGKHLMLGNVVSLATDMADRASSSASGGAVVCTGMGKSGVVAQRLAASLKSVGVRAHFVHGSEWGHGDVGGVGPGDVVVGVSHSGNTPELVGLARELQARGTRFWGVVGSAGCGMARVCHGTITAPADNELLGSVPTRSLVSQEMVCNALVSAVVHVLGVDVAAFHKNHPAGAIGAAARRDEAEAEGRKA